VADTKISAETLVSALKNAYRILVATDTGAAPDSNAATMEQVKQFLEITSPPQGMLTVASGTPVVSVSDTGNATMYYAPYVGRLVPLYDGTRFVMTDMGGELSQLLSDTGESPAAAAANSVYDYYAFLKNGSPVLSRARAWESTTARDTGNAIEMVEGIYLNKTAYTNGPAAQRGTWLGTIATDPSSAEVSMSLKPAAAAGGTNNRLGVWNAYNREEVVAFCRDNTDSWNFATDEWRAANGSILNRISMVIGLPGQKLSGAYVCMNGNTGTASSLWAVGFDDTGDIAAGAAHAFNSTAFALGFPAPYEIVTAGIGLHHAQAIERSNNSGGGQGTFFGDGGGTRYLGNGLMLRTRM
jgi:hypothetical protein